MSAGPTDTGARTDIPAQSWLARLPKPCQPYARLMRMDRPIGSWLLFLPGAWGLTLGAGGAPNPVQLALFALGAVLIRGAGCTINDYFDRHVDGRVARTATRPIPAGEVTAQQALVLFAAQSLLGLAILLTFNPLTIMLGVAAMALIIPYPLMKRITYWPQVWLGLCMTYPTLMGVAAASGGLSMAAGLLFLGGVLWTIGYDTIYAHQDREDDALVGVRSSALALGARTKPWLAGFYGAAVLAWAAAGILAGTGVAYALALLAIAAHLAWQVRKLDINDPALCLRLFKANRDVGLLIWLGLLLMTA